MKAVSGWLFAAVLAGSSAAAHAASSEATKAPAAPSKDPAVQAEADYRVGRDACNAKQEGERKACLKEAMDARDRTVNAAKATRGTNDTPKDTPK